MLDHVKPVFLVFSVVVAAGIIGGFMAANRGRSVPFWCVICALLPPFLLLLYFARPLHEVEGMYRQCPKCGELIKWHAPVCRHCKTEQSA